MTESFIFPCLKNILPRIRTALEKIIPNKEDLGEKDAQKLIERMGDRYIIPNLIFNLESYEKEEQINFLINLRIMFICTKVLVILNYQRLVFQK